MKRHRDILFLKNPDAKPFPMVITTLAALAYKGEADTITTLRNVTATMDRDIVHTVRLVSFWITAASSKFMTLKPFWIF